MHETRIAQLERENERLRQHTAELATELLANIIQVTGSLFGGEVTVKEGCDPEFPDDKYVELTSG
jgi:hypothetical protein